MKTRKLKPRTIPGSLYRKLMHMRKSIHDDNKMYYEISAPFLSHYFIATTFSDCLLAAAEVPNIINNPKWIGLLAMTLYMRSGRSTRPQDTPMNAIKQHYHLPYSCQL
jgi:hypothetical protein